MTLQESPIEIINIKKNVCILIAHIRYMDTDGQRLRIFSIDQQINPLLQNRVNRPKIDKYQLLNFVCPILRLDRSFLVAAMTL